MIEYKVITLNIDDWAAGRDLTVLGKDRWHVVACAATGVVMRVIMVRNIGPAQEPSL